MTTRELATLIGKVGLLRVAEGFMVEGRICDAKVSYGQVRVEFLPLRGEGAAWVNFDRLTSVRAEA